MIELKDKTRNLFLNREQMQKLIEASIDVSDAEYSIVYKDRHPYIVEKKVSELGEYTVKEPTYSIQNLLDKIHEQLKKHKESGYQYEGTLRICKEEPAYRFYSYFNDGKTSVTSKVEASEPTPIESLVSILIQLQKLQENNNQEIGQDAKQ